MTDFFSKIFTQETLCKIFPENRADDFFEAMYGDINDGAYDIVLEFRIGNETQLVFEFRLIQRPDKCLVCNLTYGLPNVFLKHPVININAIVADIGNLINETYKINDWKIGATLEKSRELHVIPFTVNIKES